MSKHTKEARQIPVTNKKTGQVAQAAAPDNKPRRDVLESNSDQAALGITGSEQAQVTESKPAMAAEQPGKSEKKDIDSLDEFVEFFYTGKIKSITPKVIKSIPKQLFDTEKRSELVKKALAIDSTLDKTKRLLIQLAKLDIYTSFKHTVSEFVRDVALSHPIMVGKRNDEWFPNAGSGDEGNLNGLFEATGLAEKTKSGEDAKPAGKKEQEKKLVADLQKARLNIFYLAGIWRYSKNQMSLTELTRMLRSTIYKCEVNKDEVESQLVEFLVSVQGKDASGLSCLLQWHLNQVDYDRKIADSERRKAEQLTTQLNESRNLVATSQVEIEGLKEEVNDLLKQLEAAHEKERVQGIHMRADQQQQKGRTQRILEEEIPILTDCLTALERDPPKVNVAKDRMGAVLANLNKELKELRGE